MNYTLKADHAHETLIVIYRGELSYSNRLDAVEEGGKIIQETGFDSILVDLREATLTMSATEQFSFGSSLSSNEQINQCRTAFLINRNQNDNDFIETTALNRGYKFNTFTSELMAREWLGI